ncbi:hypothetical protein [Dyella sp. SG609]|uniref:hypothetical protein n=1 Tax=Dyella sp. SG609 TaxID=2587018 RepID=UPI001446DAB1|nr:hypothetical protein [Dyella sp. SG609]NKJ21991.1 hypothetical protein [Dyella sp. SG609]
MRDYGKIHTSFWSSETLAGLDTDGRLLAVYLLTSPHTNASGAFRLPEAYACEDLGWSTERLLNSFETLSSANFAKRCAKTKWVWVCKFHEWNKPDNPNIRKAIVKSIEAIPDSVSFKQEIVSAWRVSETVSKPLGNTPSPSPSPSPSQELPALPLDDGSEFATDGLIAELRSAYPKIDVKAELAKMRVWLLANPANRKTRRGVGRFITSWLSRATPTAADAPRPPKRKELS